MSINPKTELRGVTVGLVLNWAGNIAAIILLPFMVWTHNEIVELKVNVANLRGLSGHEVSSYVPSPHTPDPQPNTAKAALAAVVPRVELPGGKK